MLGCIHLDEPNKSVAIDNVVDIAAVKMQFQALHNIWSTESVDCRQNGLTAGELWHRESVSMQTDCSKCPLGQEKKQANGLWVLQ